MASGRQIAEENVQTFIAWVATKNDADYRAMVSRGVLSRTEIAKECGFAKSALVQNPRIKAIMRDLFALRFETDLQVRLGGHGVEVAAQIERVAVGAVVEHRQAAAAAVHGALLLIHLVFAGAHPLEVRGDFAVDDRLDL